MDRTEIIERLEEIAKHAVHTLGEEPFCMSLDDGIAVKAAIEIISAQRWIPCSERLPEESGQYIITVKYVHVDGYEDLYAEHGEWDGDRWDMFCFGHCGEVEGIIAWMPLPEPYQEATL